MSDTVVELSQKFCALAEAYRRSGSPNDLNLIRLQRILLIQALLTADSRALEGIAPDILAPAMDVCLKLGLRGLPRIEIEDSVFGACRADILAGWTPAKAATSGHGALLLSEHACELGLVPDFEEIAPVLRPIWFSYLFEVPPPFKDPQDAGHYAHYLRQVCDRIAAYAAVADDRAADLIASFGDGTVFAGGGFTGVNLRDAAATCAALMERIPRISTAASGKAPSSSGIDVGSPAAAGPALLAIPSSEGPKALNRKQRRAVGKNAKAPPSAAPKPANAEVESIFATGTKYHQEGRVTEAKALYIEVLRRDSNHVGAMNNLGLLEVDLNNFAEAEVLYKRACALDPRNANSLMNLGNLYKSQEKYEQAQAAFNETLRIDPNHSMTYVNLGNVQQHLGKVDQAIKNYEKAISLNPNLPDAHLNLGNILSRMHRSEEAVACFERALKLKPDYAAAYNNMGISLLSLGKHDRAITCFEQAMHFRPNYLDAYLNIGSLYKDLGKGDEAAAYYEKILAIDPDHPGALSNLGFSLNYSDTADAQTLAQQHFRAGSRMERRFVPAPQDHANSRTPDRKLRVGYVSPDFRYHAVANFFEPLIRAHDRGKVEIFCYAEVLTPDGMTAKLQGMADHWLSTIGLSDDELAARIRADKIDILVDLAGHSNNNRLLTFARKPAPVQATWLGYPNTTGLKNIDYRLVDAVSDPPGAADSHASETLVRLEGGFLCYNPFVTAPDPVPPPCLKAGFVTFGSFNNLPKLSPATISTWSKLLKRIPTAKLVLKNRYLGEPGTRDLVMGRFAERGIGADQVSLLAGIPDVTAHMATYNDVDIGLDSFPYNGTTTTCEALWMGVPVIGLAGDRHLARVGASLLTHVGLPELVARDQDHYVEIAAALAQDIPRLTAYHAGLRARMIASPVCDPIRFARTVESAYRAMWLRWCDKIPAETRLSASVAAQ